MNKPDPGTPIFGELNNELGGLPDIDVHEFDSHSFDFGGGSAESDGAARQNAAANGGGSRSGGRRRKED
ncbi:hypothetical protein [Saccharopolyspora gregorii]|uniref:Uncharacterized protein n=1 Tax=Saccharopolyspora gregorii TaxID=33914 RepID=A0ABP6S073_9PSEU|nr:hypothetical protein [Saccharopolyspora gregorii]